MVWVTLITTVPLHPQAATAGSASGDMDHLPSGRGNTTSSRSRRLYHVDVTEMGEQCVPNELLNRVVDPADYEFGCRDIEVRNILDL